MRRHPGVLNLLPPASAGALVARWLNRPANTLRHAQVQAALMGMLANETTPWSSAEASRFTFAGRRLFSREVRGRDFDANYAFFFDVQEARARGVPVCVEEIGDLPTALYLFAAHPKLTRQLVNFLWPYFTSDPNENLQVRLHIFTKVARTLQELHRHGPSAIELALGMSTRATTPLSGAFGPGAMEVASRPGQPSTLATIDYQLLDSFAATVVLLDHAS